MSQKTFLLTCDDGYNAPGLLAVKKAVEDLGDVFVYATEKQQTCGGSKLSAFKRVKYYKRKMLDGTPCTSVNGTPIDCIWLALFHDLKDRKIDLCISGINIGQNVSNQSIILSGTFSSAFYTAVSGIPSIAIGYAVEKENMKYLEYSSRNHEGFEHVFEFPKKVVRTIVEWILENGMGGTKLWNINIPSKPTKKVRVVRMSEVGYYDNRVTKTENDFFIYGHPKSTEFPKDTDTFGIKDSIVITPCTIDFTHIPSLQKLKKIEKQLKIV